MAQKPSALFNSVLMVTYNHESFVYEAIMSIFRQTYQEPFELIISDDCSTDATSDEIRRAIQAAPDHITVEFHTTPKNLGGVNNFNFSVNHCKGDYILVADGDDISLPDRLETLVNRHQSANKSLYISNASHINDSGELDGTNRYYEEFDLSEIELQDLYTEKTPIFGASYYFNRKLITKYGEIDTTLVTYNNIDQNLFWRAWLEQGIDYISQPLIHYRIHEGGASLRNKTSISQGSLSELNKIANIVYLNSLLTDSAHDATLPVLKTSIDSLYRKLKYIASKSETYDGDLTPKIINANTISINGSEYKMTLRSLTKLPIEIFVPVIAQLTQKDPLPEKIIAEIISLFKQKKLNKQEVIALMLRLNKLWKMPYLQGILGHLAVLRAYVFRSFKLTKILTYLHHQS